MPISKASTGNYIIPSLRGGMDDTTPPHLLIDDQCTNATNVEFFFSSLGERRAGMIAMDTYGCGAVENEQAVVHLAKHSPTIDEIDAELFAIGVTYGLSTTVSRFAQGGWEDIPQVDPIDPDIPYVFGIQSQTLHGKLFIAYQSADGTDRLHVWDGELLRRVGIAQPIAAPTAATTADAGTYADTRWFRVRWVVLNDDDEILLRSEPSEDLEFEPPGNKDGATITRPALTDKEFVTHWEIEASEDGANFYRLDIIDINTTTYEDNTLLDVADYEDVGVLSEEIGDYEVPGSVKFLSADQDRLLFGGSWENNDLNARVSWSPVFNDPGVGNDERIPLDTDNFLDLDTFEGGGLTGIASTVNGTVFTFKQSQTFRMSRTGVRTHAYEAVCLSKTVGALKNCVVQGQDEAGQPVIYFLDPSAGPYRAGLDGLLRMRGLAQTWRKVNTAAEHVIGFGVFHRDKQQMHWWIALDSADAPNCKFINQVTELRQDEEGLFRGWSVATDKITAAYCGCLMSEFTEHENGAASINYRPYVGFGRSNPLPEPNIYRTDTGTDDDGFPYRAFIRTKPIFLTGLLNRWGTMTGALLATALEGGAVQVKCIRDFGLEESTGINVPLDPVDDEPFVIKQLDNLKMSSSYAIQFEFSDPE